MNDKGQTTSVFAVILIIIAFAVFYVYALAPLTFVASDIGMEQAGSTQGVWGFFVAWFPYLILLGFILLAILWPIFAG